VCCHYPFFILFFQTNFQKNKNNLNEKNNKK